MFPKYRLIKNTLKKELSSGMFESGDQFYTEAELIKRFDVSSITVIRALNELVAEGYIVRQQGRGTFVSRARKGQLLKFSDIELFPIQKEKVHVLSITRDNKNSYLKKLNLTKYDFYYLIERVRTVDEQPFIYQQTYLPEQYINSNYPDLDYYRSIYKRYKLDYNIHMEEENFIETNEIVFPTPEEVREKLALKKDEPSVLQIKTTTQKETDQVLEYVESYKKWDYYKIELNKQN